MGSPRTGGYTNDRGGRLILETQATEYGVHQEGVTSGKEVLTSDQQIEAMWLPIDVKGAAQLALVTKKL